MKSKRTKSGPLNAVPCPWCSKRNNHSELDQVHGQETYKKSGLTIQCDHCRKRYIVKGVQTVIKVAQYHEETKENV